MDAIGTLAGGIAHDFNNILSGIIGYAELLEIFEVKSQQELRQKTGYILQAAYRAKDLVRQILTFSRKVDISCQKIHLVPLINEIVILLRASFPATIEIETSFTTEKDTVFADSTQMHQVLLNLCTNALDAMKEDGGILVIKLSQVDSSHRNTVHPDVQDGNPWLLLEVQDSGIGMAPEVMDRVFEPYYTMKKTGEGTGLGLAMVFGIVRSCNGHVFLESQQGVGSTFRIYLPLHEQKEEDAVPIPLSIVGGHGSILLVDDEDDIVQVGKELLERLGYSVTATTSSSEALRCFANAPQSFDLLLTDQTMPGMTGLNLALNIREIREDIPILLCTGSGTVLSQDALPGTGRFKALQKPVSLNVLANIVNKILGAG